MAIEQRRRTDRGRDRSRDRVCDKRSPGYTSPENGETVLPEKIKASQATTQDGTTPAKPCSAQPSCLRDSCRQAFKNPVRTTLRVCGASTVMSCHVVSCRVMSCHVMSCRVMSCHAVSCSVMWCHVVSCGFSFFRFFFIFSFFHFSFFPCYFCCCCCCVLWCCGVLLCCCVVVLLCCCVVVCVV